MRLRAHHGYKLVISPSWQHSLPLEEDHRAKPMPINTRSCGPPGGMQLILTLTYSHFSLSGDSERDRRSETAPLLTVFYRAGSSIEMPQN